VIGTLMVLARGGRAGPAPVARVLVVDGDDSFVSQALVQALSSEQARMIEAEVVAGIDEARARIDRGEASALLVVPKGFARAVLREEPCKLELITNPSQRILPGMIESALEMLREAVFYVHRVFGDELRDFALAAEGEGAAENKHFDDLAVAATSVRIRADFERISDFLFPPAIAVETVIREVVPAGRPARSFAESYLAGILLMALLFMAEGLADDLWRERALGVLRRTAIAPSGAAPALLGKLAAGWTLMLATAVLGMVLAAAFFRIDPVRAASAALWASLAGATLFALMLALKTFASSQRAAGLVGNLVLFPLMMVGGSLFPFEAMPPWLARIGRWTPNGWSVGVLDRILFASPAPSEVALATLASLVAIAVLVSLCAARMRRFARAA
jgi:ABC-type transport system involved in cytochrome c biogenesis permease component